MMRGSVTPPITSPDGVQLVKHTDNFTHYINASLKATSMWKENVLPIFCYCFYPHPPHCTVKILVFTCRAYLAPNKFTLGRNIDASKLYVVRNAERVNLVMTSVTSISITVLKLFLPDIPSCFSVKC